MLLVDTLCRCYDFLFWIRNALKDSNFRDESVKATSFEGPEEPDQTLQGNDDVHLR